MNGKMGLAKGRQPRREGKRGRERHQENENQISPRSHCCTQLPSCCPLTSYVSVASCTVWLHLPYLAWFCSCLGLSWSVLPFCLGLLSDSNSLRPRSPRVSWVRDGQRQRHDVVSPRALRPCDARDPTYRNENVARIGISDYDQGVKFKKRRARPRSHAASTTRRRATHMHAHKQHAARSTPFTDSHSHAAPPP